MLTTIHTSRRDLTERTTRGRPTQMAAAACAVVLAFTFFGLSGIAMAKGQATVSVAKLKGIGSDG